MQSTIRLEDVIVPKDYADTYPNKQKMDKIRDYVYEHRKLDKPIVVHENVLIDGYARYIVAMEYELEEVDCEVVNVFYVSGKFEADNKERTWKVIDDSVIEIGDKVMVKSIMNSYYDKKTKKRCIPTEVVTVTNVFESDDLSLLRHKTIIKKVE